MDVLSKILAALPWYVWVLAVSLLAIVVAVKIHGARVSVMTGPGDDWRVSSARWASPADVADLVDDRIPAEATSGRLLIGQMSGHLLTAPKNWSMAVICPTGGGKTARVVVPNVLRHQGPALVASVKGDVLALTRTHRERLGDVHVFDPTGVSGVLSSRWSPLMGIHDYEAATTMAKSLADAASMEGLEDASFWEQQGQALIAPMLYAAALTGLGMADVADWIGNPALETRIQKILETHTVTGGGHGQVVGSDAEVAGDCRRAKRDWHVFTSTSDRTKSSIILMGSSVLKAWGSAQMAATTTMAVMDPAQPGYRPILDLDALLPTVDPATGEQVFPLDPATGQPRFATVYIVAPESEQDAYKPVFMTIINELLRRVEVTAQHLGGVAIKPPLFLCLDEAANIAPLPKLGKIVSKARGEGVLVMTAWQDLGQIVEQYGAATARTILSNHLVKLYIPGMITDLDTLKTLSELIGTDDFRSVSQSTGYDVHSMSTSFQIHDEVVAPPWWLRIRSQGETVTIMSSKTTIRAYLPGWYEEDSGYIDLMDPVIKARFDQMYEDERSATSKKRRTRTRR